MPIIGSLVGAPKYFALASVGVTCAGFLLADDEPPPKDGPKVASALSNPLSKCGVIVASGLMGYSSALTVFNRHAVLDALRCRPKDAASILRSAGGRVGACTAASMILLHIYMDGIVSTDPEIPLSLRLYASTLLCGVALPFALPAVGISYGLGSAVGIYVGRRILEQRCRAGTVCMALDKWYKSNAAGARVTAGATAVATMYPYYFLNQDDPLDLDGELYDAPHRRGFRRDDEGTHTSVWTYERQWPPQLQSPQRSWDNAAPVERDGARNQFDDEFEDALFEEDGVYYYDEADGEDDDDDDNEDI